MTDTNHIEVLHGFVEAAARDHNALSHDYVKDEKKCPRCKSLEQARAAITALSARASAGEGVSRLMLAVIGRKHFGNPIPQEWYAAARELLNAAPQPAQAGASGGGVAEIVRDLCELSPADPDAPETVCVRVADLERIVERHTTPASPATGDIEPDAIVSTDREGDMFIDVRSVTLKHGDKLYRHPPTPQPAAAHPELPSAQGWLDSHCAVATTEWMRGWDAARSALAAAAPQPQEASAQGEIVAIVGERGSVSWRSERIPPVGAPLYSTPPAHGDGEVRIGATRCYGDDAWFRELTVQGVTFLAPLDDQDRARHILTRPTPEAQEARAEPIKAGILGEGRSNLSFHALRPDGSAACSSYLFVRYEGRLAHEIGRKSRCKSKACQKLFDKADADAALALPAQGEG